MARLSRLQVAFVAATLAMGCNFQPVRDPSKILCESDSHCNPGEDCLPRANDGLKVCSPTTGSSGSGGAGGRSGGAGGTGRGGSGAGGSGQGGTTGGGTPGGGGGSAGSDGGRPDVTEVGGDVLRPDTPADVTVEVGPPADWPECPDNAKAIAQTEIDNGVVVYVPFEDESTSVMLDDWSVNPHRVLPKDLDLTT
ncbi:MAG TPA: hypothetical protein VGG33_20415, partial [Polyangia bacterium]